MNISRFTSMYGRRGWTAFIFVLSLSTLQGCGGGGGDNVTNANPNGYYSNAGSADVKAADNMNPRPITDLQGMIHDGQFVMLSESAQLAYHGTITVRGNTFTGSVIVYEDGTGDPAPVPISGTINADKSIDGTLSGAGAGNGTFALKYSDENVVAVDNGNLFVKSPWWEYVRDYNFFKLSIADVINPQSTNFSNQSQPLGSVFNECRISGRIDPVATHVYSVSVVMSNCTNSSVLVNPNYSGLATLRTENSMTPNDRFVISLSNGAYSINGEFK